ncbi:hypothetical protein BRD17_06475 [Halobacteriales archaeon SW_7_68_16]|nr:MAG: hypothetical protein BRD17_06475 [Halobacteriales archaeon SW_7_68_16]
MDRPARRRVLTGLGASVAGLAGCLGLGGGGDGGETDPGATWLTTPMTDVLTDETFTIGSFDRPVVLETFAVWCSICTDQQREVWEFHGAVGDDAVSVSLNVDPNEDARRVRDHAAGHGFDWRYAVAPPSVTRSLVNRFGQGVTNAPSAPVVRLCPGGSARKLRDGVKPADELRTAIERCSTA